MCFSTWERPVSSYHFTCFYILNIDHSVFIQTWGSLHNEHHMLCWVVFIHLFNTFQILKISCFFWRNLEKPPALQWQLLGAAGMLSGRWGSLPSRSPSFLTGQEDPCPQTTWPTQPRAKRTETWGRPRPLSSALISNEHPRVLTCFCCFPRWDVGLQKGLYLYNNP